MSWFAASVRRRWAAAVCCTLLASVIAFASAATTTFEPASYNYDRSPTNVQGADATSPPVAVFSEPLSRLTTTRRGELSQRATFLAAEDEYVNLATEARTTHILQGDATGGGHLWPGLPGKTPFPEDWSASRVMHEISDVATDPASGAVVQGGKTVITGTRGGVDIRVIIDTKTGEIVTGYPTNLPRNP